MFSTAVYLKWQDGAYSYVQVQEKLCLFFQVFSYPPQKNIICASVYRNKEKTSCKQQRKKLKILYSIIIKDGWIWIEF